MKDIIKITKELMDSEKFLLIREKKFITNSLIL